MNSLITVYGENNSDLRFNLSTVSETLGSPVTHSFYSDRPEKWQELVECIREHAKRHLEEAK